MAGRRDTPAGLGRAGGGQGQTAGQHRSKQN